MNETQTERRKSRRFRLRLAVVFSWRDEHGALQSGEGCSGDISGRGIYVRTKCAPAAGNSVEINVFLPQPAYDIRAAEIHAKGQVTRVDQGRRGQVCGFATMNRSVVIREPIVQALGEHGAEQRPSARQQRIVAKQDAGLRRY
jgi:PilZ domain-containing protein